MQKLQRISYEFTHDERRLRVVLRGGPGNCLDSCMASELGSVLLEKTDGRHLRCVTIEGSVKGFCCGTCVPECTRSIARPLFENLHGALSALLHLNVPTAAAVRGDCLGAGFEIALACNRIVAAPAARFGVPEIVLGLFSPAGSVLLPERVGRGIAEEMLLGGRVLGAADARAAGLVDDVADDPEAAATAWFEKHLLPQSAMALRFATRAARATLTPRLNATLLELERLFVDELTQTHDAREGVASYVANRPPVWTDA